MKWSERVGRLVAIPLIVSLVPFACAWALWQENGNPICTAPDDQDEVRVTSDGEGGAVLVWEDNQIFAQRVDSSGAMMWDMDGISICTARSTERYPRVVSDGAGGAIIAWEDYRGSLIGGKNIYAQRVDASGNLVWSPLGVAICTATGDQFSPRVVPDGQGGAIIVWRDCRDGSSNADIYVQRVGPLGVVKWSGNGVAVCTASGDQDSPEIVSDGAGGTIVAWQDFRSNSDYDIYAQLVDSSGVAKWTGGGVAISAASGNQTRPQIATDGAGGAIITWRDSPGGSGDIYAQRVNGSGTVQWVANVVPICTAMGDQDQPEIVSDGAGGAIITWHDMRNLDNYDIYAQLVDSLGVVRWVGNGVGICVEEYGQMDPTITSDGAGGAIVTWRDYRNANHWDIYAQRVDTSGVEGWTVGGVPVCMEIDNQFYPRIVSDGAGGAIIGWEDHRGGGDYDIYAQRLTADGEFVGVVDEVVVPVRASELSQNVPNPFNPLTHITFRVAVPGEARLRVYDIAGRLVRTLVADWREPGVYSEVWDGKGDEGNALPCGVYFYSIKAGHFVATRKMVLLH